MLLRLAAGQVSQPLTAISNSRTLQAAPEIGSRASRRGSKARAAVASLSHLLALRAAPANAQERARVEILVAAVREATGQTVAVAYIAQGNICQELGDTARACGIWLEVGRLPAARSGFPRPALFRRLPHEYERLPTALAGLRSVAFAWLMLHGSFLSDLASP